MRAVCILLIVICVAAGCKRRDKIPADVIPPDKMEKVLWDMIRADEFVAGFILPNDSTKIKKTESIALYEKVFRIHRISKEEFQRSFSYYRSKPSVLRTLTDSLQRHMQSSLTDEKQTRYSPDSINKRIKMKEQ